MVPIIADGDMKRIKDEMTVDQINELRKQKTISAENQRGKKFKH